MYVPTGGFGWITRPRHHRARDLGVPAQPAAGHHHRGRQPGRARRGGRRSGGVSPEQKAWGYTGTFTDPDGHLWEAIVSAI